MPKVERINKTAVNFAEAKAQPSQLVERVERGEVILIGRDGRVVAKLVPPENSP
ncbi:type II toxin-antitoxin system Phd/YefM family antitoxin [Thermus caliditerrae]|uniref:type II toxin-antitoxin system Phd/YefM family antitoxin n=1 Tax=Thermus caliditerrae TaxID=1330700 RepID=UPI001F2627D1|nr:type II toxin-antitoxin system prevent-host-death family antitoxin [Thermus caliditerrae]